ncbi:MAG TPA: 2OG-Fe(II) oxygenase [Alphaproteobacteria bacterium]|jgi:predicted 2-oxoglutarate/Fe(II)-dependent dioxygenase YbiX/peroxiredoxin
MAAPAPAPASASAAPRGLPPAAPQPGDSAPWFAARSTNNARYMFHTVAGRYVLLGFFGSARRPEVVEALRQLMAHRSLFDDAQISMFGVSVDPADESEGRLQQVLPGIRHFWDFDLAVSKLYGATTADAVPGARLAYRSYWLLLDPMLRVVRAADIGKTAEMLDAIAALPPIQAAEAVAPVLVLPRVLEPELCRELIARYEAGTSHDSGFMRDVDGMTQLIMDHSHKRRADYHIVDEQLQAALRQRVQRRLIPEIAKAFQFHVTRMERYIVSCYDAETGGHFRAHRDNTTKGTAHRRFAVTINLNAEDYEGGDLRFPEYGARSYRAPTGGAVVFACSLLHEALPVTRGKRYAFLPFLYDDAAAAVRDENRRFLADMGQPAEDDAGAG